MKPPLTTKAVRTGPGHPPGPVPSAAATGGAPPRPPVPAFVLLVLCATGGALAALALPAALGTTLDRIVADGRVPWSALAVCAALTAAEAGFDALVTLLGGTSTATGAARLRAALLDRLLGAEPGRASAHAPGDLTTRLTANAAEAATVPAAVAQTVGGVLIPVGATVALFAVDPWTGLALLAGFPALLVLLRLLVRRTSVTAADYQREQALVAARLTEVLDGAATVRAAGTAARERARVTEPLGRLSAHGHRTWDIHGRAAAGAAVLLPLLSLLVLAVAGLRTATGALGVGDLLAASRYALLAIGLGVLTSALSGIARGRSAARRLDPLLALPAVPHRARTLPPAGNGTLELRAVEVVRDGRRLLAGVSFTVPGGTSAALVGRSGAGKSLVAAVAGRLADPDAGTVLLDGVPLDTLAPGPLRQAVAHAFARPAPLGTTLADTVTAGPTRPYARTLRRALRDASAADFTGRLPLGLDTPLTDAPLSGGEHQRLGLARAFARDARLLILDDATSSLDTVTDHRVQRALARMAGTRTRLVVTHRASAAAAADQVIWLADGTVRATGSHADLWRDAAEYRALFAADGEHDGQDGHE
ncbi:ABC transporter ATP-binding protein [Streptomyces sp. NPDC048290]|uniref:ABC transporter ATP-binding protein n=1 Tax=Streptomyces sp. NPDC048290 TaxID=3155811 RepID=UPI00342C0C58